MPRPWALALWEGGSVARGRRDAHSDVDVHLLVEDDAVERAFASIARALGELGVLDRQLRMPEPTWHGHGHAFYHLAGTPPTLMIDAVVMKRSAEQRYLEPERHGIALVHFDKEELVCAPAFDAEALRGALRREYESLCAKVEMFHDVLVPKEIARARSIDAAQYYHAFTLAPLVRMLGILHRPLRHDFTRYAHEELPEEVVRRLAPLYFVRDLEELRVQHERAVAFFWEAAAEVDLDAIDLESASKQARGGSS